MEEQEIPFWDYKNKDADNILPIDFLEKVVSLVFFVSCLDKFAGVHEIININI